MRAKTSARAVPDPRCKAASRFGHDKKKKRIRARCFRIGLVSLLALVVCTEIVYAQAVSTGHDIYAPNEPITVVFNALPGNDRDWITVASAGSPDDKYGEWVYTEGRRAGTHVFRGLPEGRYEIRVYYNWSEGGYAVRLRHPFRVQPPVVENLSAEFEMPELWTGWDTGAAADKAVDEITQDKPAEALLMLSMDTIIERMVKERNAEKLARLEAAYKRKLLRFFQGLGLFKNKRLPAITTAEIKKLTEAYRYAPTAAQRVSGLARAWAGLSRVFNEGVAAWVRKRLGAAVTARLFSRVFGPVSTLHDIATIVEFVQETEKLKDSWAGALKSMEQMACADYNLYVFRKNVPADERARIVELRRHEAEYFASQGLKAPSYPPWEDEISGCSPPAPATSSAACDPTSVSAEKSLVGTWSGWGGVEIKQKGEEYEGTYGDTYGTGTGKFEFRKSAGCTYVGKWGESAQRFGSFTLTVSREGNSIEVVWQADTSSPIGPGASGKSTWSRNGSK